MRGDTKRLSWLKRPLPWPRKVASNVITAKKTCCEGEKSIRAWTTDVCDVYLGKRKKASFRNINLTYLSRKFWHREQGNTSLENIRSRGRHFYGPFVRSCVKLEENSRVAFALKIALTIPCASSRIIESKSYDNLHTIPCRHSAFSPSLTPEAGIFS